MLTKREQRLTAYEPRPDLTQERDGCGTGNDSRWRRAMRVEWLGQTAASIFWIASVLTYGLQSAGDWLQICAASAWLVANIATLSADESRADDSANSKSR